MGHFYTYITTTDSSWITGRFKFFTAHTHIPQAGIPVMLVLEFFNLFCASIYVIISFLLISDVIIPSPFLFLLYREIKSSSQILSKTRV